MLKRSLVAIVKLNDADKRELQEASLSNADKLELLFRQKLKGGDDMMSKEQFLGRLLADYTHANTKEGAGTEVAQESREEKI